MKPPWLTLSSEVEDALMSGRPVVALESTVIAHGLPRPRNLDVAFELEEIVRSRGASPATVGVVDGAPVVGLSREQLARIATEPAVTKLSTRELPLAVTRGVLGATTVAATAFLAASAGIEIFATGGIGGVHRGSPPDVSADLIELQRTRILVVSAGAKSILDLPATREALETLGILVLGWRTTEFPAFYTVGSGLEVDDRVEDAASVARIWREHRRLGAAGAALLCVPIPASAALDAAAVDRAIEGALRTAAEQGVAGKHITPFLLRALADTTGGATLDANLALLRNNAAVAAEVAVALRTS